ncbi:MAG: serine acetyltransferase [Ruminococcus sp.]|uniref:serine O-acetyltransferase n=1 Tax=Ruminococcus sp. TaxID=41978 RepID=UPI002873A155|nr:serine acetyltransferase [Ruminococcus sp.]MBQ3285202.1 serine acetyltransferase [Ruminococcus sp.]
MSLIANKGMKYKFKTALCFMRLLLIFPGIQWKNKKLMMDLSRWKEILSIDDRDVLSLALLMSKYPEFRNLFLYRCKGGFYKRWVKFVYPPMDTLYLDTPEIGGGLFIQHGFATMIAAASIGENCWINQQVTIGHTGRGRPPIIGNNVTITCGAKVLGPITLGDNVTIGANACVVKDVEPGAVMGGVPAKRIR